MVNRTNEVYEIVKILPNNRALVQFKNYNELLDRNLSSAYSGDIKNPFKPIVYGVGYYGFTNSRAIKKDRKYKVIYNCWKDMLRRCYDNKRYEYTNVFVHTDWHSFKNFYLWCLTPESNWNYKYSLDKDILSDDMLSKFKIYSPSTCVFVPKYINNLIKPNNQISGITYNKLERKYKVQITHQRYYLGGFQSEEYARIVYSIASTIYNSVTIILSYNKQEIPNKVYLKFETFYLAYRI